MTETEGRGLPAMIPVRCSTASGGSVASVAQQEPLRVPATLNQLTPNYMGEK